MMSDEFFIPPQYFVKKNVGEVSNLADVEIGSV
jgi:hypothetical protein